MVAVRVLEGVDFIRRFQRDHHMPYSAGGVVDQEDDVSGADLGVILQLAAWVLCIPEDEGADHCRVSAAGVGAVYRVGVHNALGLCAGNIIFVGSRCFGCPPDGVLGPVPLDLVELFQHGFLGKLRDVGCGCGAADDGSRQHTCQNSGYFFPLNICHSSVS